jgi:hypothetical protein
MLYVAKLTFSDQAHVERLMHHCIQLDSWEINLIQQTYIHYREW